MKKWSVLGAGRGLGRAFALAAAEKCGADLQLQLSSRKLEKLTELQAELKALNAPTLLLSVDFTREAEEEKIFEQIKSFQPERLFYFAGGGPFGTFQDKQWKDHLWSLRLNVLFPARLLHESLKWDFVKQWVFVGSSVAEAQADPLAASYAAGKHGLLGLVRSVAEESQRDIRLFSPSIISGSKLARAA